MNAKIPVVVICVKAIIYLLLHNLHNCTFQNKFLAEHLRTTASVRTTKILHALKNIDIILVKFTSMST